MIVFITLMIISAIIKKKQILAMKIKKAKKQYALDPKLAIAIDVAAAKKQVSSSSIVEEAVYKYLKIDSNNLEVA
jgi:hypothetical protein